MPPSFPPSQASLMRELCSKFLNSRDRRARFRCMSAQSGMFAGLWALSLVVLILATSEARAGAELLDTYVTAERGGALFDLSIDDGIALSTGSSGGSTIAARRLNASGVPLWKRHFETTPAEGSSLVRGVLAVGSHTLVLTERRLRRLDETGTELWDVEIPDFGWLMSFFVDNTGRIYLCGGGDGDDNGVLAISPQGERLWTRTSAALGHPGYAPLACARVADGMLLQFDGKWEVVRLSRGGDLLWTKFHVPFFVLPTTVDLGASLTQELVRPQGEVLQWLDATGTVVRSLNMDPSNVSDTTASLIAVEPNGDVFVALRRSVADMIERQIVRYNAAGTVAWQQSFELPNHAVVVRARLRGRSAYRYVYRTSEASGAAFQVIDVSASGLQRRSVPTTISHHGSKLVSGNNQTYLAGSSASDRTSQVITFGIDSHPDGMFEISPSEVNSFPGPRGSAIALADGGFALAVTTSHPDFAALVRVGSDEKRLWSRDVPSSKLGFVASDPAQIYLGTETRGFGPRFGISAVGLSGEPLWRAPVDIDTSQIASAKGRPDGGLLLLHTPPAGFPNYESASRLSFVSPTGDIDWMVDTVLRRYTVPRAMTVSTLRTVTTGWASDSLVSYLDPDCFAVAYDPAGLILWQRLFEEAPTQDYCESIVDLSEDRYLIGGRIVHGQTDVLLRELDAGGNSLVRRTIDLDADAIDIRVARSGSAVYGAGKYRNRDEDGASGVFVARLGARLQPVWISKIEVKAQADVDGLSLVATDAGVSVSGVHFGQSGQGPFLLRLSPDGALLFQGAERTIDHVGPAVDTRISLLPWSTSQAAVAYSSTDPVNGLLSVRVTTMLAGIFEAGFE